MKRCVVGVGVMGREGKTRRITTEECRQARFADAMTPRNNTWWRGTAVIIFFSTNQENYKQGDTQDTSPAVQYALMHPIVLLAISDEKIWCPPVIMATLSYLLSLFTIWAVKFPVHGEIWLQYWMVELSRTSPCILRLENETGSQWKMKKKIIILQLQYEKYTGTYIVNTYYSYGQTVHGHSK